MKKTALLLCFALVFGMFAGCSGDAGYTPKGDALEDADYTVTLPTQEEPEQDPYSMAYDLDEAFNPFEVTSISNQLIFSLVYQGLFAVNRDYEAEGILCKSYTVTKDQCTFTFMLEDATFSDGTALTASDVVASLEAAQESEVYEGRFDKIESISVVDDCTVEIVTECSYENLPMLLDIPIVKASQVGADLPLGTGPYVLRKLSEGYVLERRGSWWCSAELPVSAETIQLKGYETAVDIRNGFQYDDIGISVADPGHASYAQYRNDYELWEMETGIFLYLGCNASSSVLSNDNVRAALAYAIDRSAIVEECYNGFGYAATLAASPNSPFYDKNLASTIYYDSIELEQALNDSGMAGATVTFIVLKTDQVRTRAARMIAQMLEDCGLVVDLVECTAKAYEERMLYGIYDLYLGQTKLCATMDLSQFYASDGSLNAGGMTNSTINNMCKNALENSGNFYNLHKLVVEDGQLIPVLFRTYAVYARRGLISDLSPARDNAIYYSLGKPASEIMSIAVKVEQEN